MPIDYVPGMSKSPEGQASDDRRVRAVVREAMRVAVRSALICLVVSEAVLLTGMYALKNTLLASQHLMRLGSDQMEAFWPAVLFGIFGLAFGCLVGWWISASSGLAGRDAWLIGAAAAVCLALTASAAAPALFPQSVPAMCWLGIVVMAAAAMPGVSYFAVWAN